MVAFGISNQYSLKAKQKQSIGNILAEKSAPKNPPYVNVIFKGLAINVKKLQLTAKEYKTTV